MSTVFSYTNSKGQNIFWPGIQYAGKIQSSRFIRRGIAGFLFWMIECCMTGYMQFLVLLSETLTVAHCWSGPDPRRPEMPSEGKLRSEKAICAASIDLNDCKDAGGLRESLEALGLPDQVRNTPICQQGRLLHCTACAGVVWQNLLPMRIQAASIKDE